MTIENLLRESVFYYWFLIPSIVAVFVSIKSTQFLIKNRSLINWMLTAFIIGLLFFSEYILGVIFFMDAWPTFLPHIGIGIALIICIIQYFVNKN